MIIRILRQIHILAGAVLLCTLASSPPMLAEDTEHPDGWKPASGDPGFYDNKYRTARLRVETKTQRGEISPRLLGVNTSYFNDTDELWEQNDLRGVLREAGVRAMRYPGGEETSFFHWQHPGVNGYEDIRDDPATHGSAPGRGPFQATWTPPKDWATNEAFMSFDDFMAHCRSVGAEPIVGLNLSAGRRHDDRPAALNDALEWMRYSREKGYEVRYWFLDNEPWHHESAYQFDIGTEYVQDVLYFGEAIKKEFPEARLIANPIPWQHQRQTKFMVEFLQKTGHVLYAVDVHYYWAWGLANWQYWLEQSPMTTTDRWSQDKPALTVAQDIAHLRQAMRQAGHPEMAVMILEWNVAPSPELQPISESGIALMQAQMLMEMIDADVEMTCLWPLIWRTRPEVWPEADIFRSIVSQDPPFEPTRSAQVFSMVAPLQGMQRVATESDRDDLIVQAAVGDGDTDLRVLLLSKSPSRRRVRIALDRDMTGSNVEAQSLSMLRDAHALAPGVEVQPQEIVLFAEPFSFTSIRLSTTPSP